MPDLAGHHRAATRVLGQASLRLDIEGQLQDMTKGVPVALRVIQVGLGGWGRDWAVNVIPKVSSIECVALVDADPTCLAKACDRLAFPKEATFTSLSSALQIVEADAVLVTATVAAHAPLATEALRAGKHVLVEKPFARSVAEACAVVDLANELGRTLMVSQNYRFYPAARLAARLVAEEYVGAVGRVRVDFRKWANDGRPGGRHYTLFHPLLYDMAIHHFDLMRMVLGQDAVRVYAQACDPAWSKFAEPASAVLTLSFERGTVVSYRGSWVSSGEPTTWSGAWHIECENGEIYWTGRDGGAGETSGDVVTVRHRRDGSIERLDLASMMRLDYVGRAGALAEFARAIAEGEEPECSGRRNLGSLAISEAAARSTVTGRVEPVAGPWR